MQTSPARLPALTPAVETVPDQEVKELLEKQAVHPVDHKLQTEGFISSMFVVPKKDGGNCPVVNLKPLNQYLVYEHFKMEGIHMLRDLLQQGDFFGEDRSKGCLSVGTHQEKSPKVSSLSLARKHARVCLPSLRLSYSPKGFHKIDEARCTFEAESIRLIIYLDDILVMAESQDLVLHHAASVLNLLESLGFLVNYKKSLLVPSQQIEFLGLLIHSMALTIQLPAGKLRKILKNCQNFQLFKRSQ